jgi:hypothetical protein
VNRQEEPVRARSSPRTPTESLSGQATLDPGNGPE